MKIINPSIVLLCIFFIACQGLEDKKEDLKKRPVDLINYSHPKSGLPTHNAEFSDSIFYKLDNGTLRASKSYHKLLQIGKYQNVNEMTDLKLDWGLDSIDSGEINYLASFSYSDASTEIIEAAKNHEIIIFAESHTKPNHRVLVSQLLRNLYKIGYRSLGLENIVPLYQSKDGELLDSLMNQRAYPLITGLSGIYTSESHYANLIREAKRIGFNIFAYERNGSSDAERDQQQAEHIKTYMDNHPNEKIVCYGGWYHAIEAPIKKRGKEGDYWMAYELKQLSGKDPLTIYLDAFNEKVSEKTKSSPYYDHLISQHGNPDSPTVLKDKKGKFYRGINNQLPFDILTLSPKNNHEENGLPSWLSYYKQENGWKQIDYAKYINKHIETHSPILIKIMEPYANDLATLIHCYEINKKVNQFKLPVFLEKNRLIITNNNGEVIFDEIV